MRPRQLPSFEINGTNQAIFAIWLVIAIFIIYLITSMVRSRLFVEQRVRDQADSYARLVEEHASATFNQANIAMMAVIDHLSPADLSLSGLLPKQRREAIEKLLRSQLQ